MLSTGQSKTVNLGKSVQPPLSIKSTIQLAWGLTLNFSHEDTQKNVGKYFLDWLKDLRTNYGQNPQTQAYIDNLHTLLSSYLRTSGFERETFQGYLDSYKNLREAETKNINDIADVASLSSGSILTKLAAFLGFGSLAEIIGTLAHFATPTQGLPFNLNYVIFGGLGGLALTLVSVRLARGPLIHRTEKHTYQKQLDLWRDRAAPMYEKELFFLFEQVKSLVGLFYDNYDEDILHWSPVQLTDYFRSIIPDKDLYQITEKPEEPKS